MFDFRSYTKEQKERILEKFEASFERKDKKECWIWHGEWRPHHGYGRLRIRHKDLQVDEVAHRAAWAIHYETFVPQDRLCCHTCDIRRCVNPWHLKLADAKDNIMDREIRGRGRPNGKDPIPFYKKVDMLRRFVAGESSIKLGKEFGYNFTNFGRWLRRKEMIDIFGRVDLSHRNPIVKQAKLKAQST